MLQLHYRTYTKYTNLFLGLFFILLFVIKIFRLPGNVSILDYEGFDISILCTLALGILSLLYWLYQVKKNDVIHFIENGFTVEKLGLEIPYNQVQEITKNWWSTTLRTNRGDFTIVHYLVYNHKALHYKFTEVLGFILNRKALGWGAAVFVLMIVTVLFMFFALLDRSFDEKAANFLPLKKIETTQIEGTIDAKAILSYKEGSGGQLAISIPGGLVEYPDVNFLYNTKLKNKVFNTENIDRSIRKEDIYILPEGTIVKLRLRIADYEKMKQYLARDKDMDDDAYDHRAYFEFYELIVGDEVLAQKVGLDL